MLGQHEPFSINVGSKLLLVAILLLISGALAVALPLVAMAIVPAAEAETTTTALASQVGAIMPGLGILAVGLVLSIIAGLFLGYAHNKYPGV